jgi:TPR repeat protein
VDGIFHLGYYTMDEASKTNEEERYAEAAELFRDALAVDPEYVEAYYYMGFLFENGLGVDRDMKTAFRYYRKAADLDHGKSWTKIGTFYAKGFGVNRDPKAAIMAYEKAVKLVDDEAMNILGIIYEEGIDVPMNFEKAFQYYLTAAELGNAKAKLNLGLMFERGRIEKNIEEAVTCYVEAADMGNVTAQMMLSTRDLNTAYRGSMSRILGRGEDTTIYDAIDVDTIVTDVRHGSPNKDAVNQFPVNATSQYVKNPEMRSNQNIPKKSGFKKESIPEDEEGEVEYY